MTAIERYEEPSFDVVLRQAEMLAKSNIVPKAFRGKPGDIVVATLLGREIGLGPMATMTYVDVIEGNATLNAEGKVALVRRAGHSISGEVNDQAARVEGKRSDSGDHMTVTWTMDMAKRAGLAGKAVWKQYPEAMLWSRAVSQLCRMLFADVLMGLSYTGEEVEAFAPAGASHTVDSDATAAAVMPVAALPAPQKSMVRPPPGGVAQAIVPVPREPVGEEEATVVASSQPVDEWDAKGLQSRIDGLTDEFRQIARAAWKDQFGNTPPARLEDDEVLRAVTLIGKIEDQQTGELDKRRKRANAEMTKVGVTSDDARHELVSEATGGQTTSTGALTEAQLSLVVDFCGHLAAMDAEGVSA